MSGSARRYAPLLQLRRLRTEQAERAMRRCIEALEDGRVELQKARDIEDDWWRASRKLDEWSAAVAPVDRVRWATVAGARRADIDRSLREARDYVHWWETEIETMREAVVLARTTWRRERARLDALERRRDGERRAAANREEESVFQESADAAATARAAGAAR